MFKLTSKQEIDINAPLKPGVYRIYWIKNGKPQMINRLASSDKSGLLYIGKTDGTLRKRLNEFRCSAFINSTNHSAGLKHRLNIVLKTLIKADELYVEIDPCDRSSIKETEELKKYALIYGEVPPLNG